MLSVSETSAMNKEGSEEDKCDADHLWIATVCIGNVWSAGLPEDGEHPERHSPPTTRPDAPVSSCVTTYPFDGASYGSRVDFDEIMGGERVSRNGAIHLVKTSIPQEGFDLKNLSKNYDYEVTWRYQLGGRGPYYSVKAYVYKGTTCHLLFTKETSTTQIDTKGTFARTVGGRR